MDIKNELSNKYGTINMSKFLSRFYSLTGEKLKKITHEVAKKLRPDLVEVPFDAFDKGEDREIYLELLKEGKILIVDDGYDVVAYFTPVVCNYEDDMELLCEEDEEDIVNDNKYDYTKLSIYELRQLLRRKFSSYRNQCCARKELMNRGVVLHKKYNRNEIKKIDNSDY